MTCSEGVTQRLTHPVGVNALCHPLSNLIVFRTQCAVGITIQLQLIDELHILLGIQQIIAGEIRQLRIQVQGIAYAQLALLRTLRLHDDHTVGCSCTIDSGSCGIFQHCNTLHTVHIQVDDTLHGGLITIKDKQRLVRIAYQARLIDSLESLERALSTESDLWHGIRIATHLGVLCQRDRGIEQGQTLDDILMTHHLQFITVIDRGITGEVLGITVHQTGYHHLTNRIGIISKTYIDITLSTGLDALRFHSDKTDQQGTLMRKIHAEGTIRICYGNSRCTF